MKPFPRLLAQTACVAAALCCTVPASAADTPRDYAMPYSLDAVNGGVRFKGITLVNSANFNDSKRLVAKTIPVGTPATVVSGELDDTGLHDLRPHSLVWAQGNRWMRVPLRTGLEPTPVAFSSESAANTSCADEVIYRDFTAPTESALFYQLPGNNGTCNDNDDVVRWVSLDNGPGADPSTMTGFDNLELNPIYKNDAQLHAIYTLQGGSILRIASDLVNIATVRSSVNKFEVVGSLPDGTVIALIDGNIERIRPGGALASSPLRRPRAGYRIAQAVLHGNDVYFAEKAKEDAETFQTRIGRVGADGTTDAVAMLNLRLPASIDGFTSSRMVYTVTDDEADTVTLFSFPQNGSNGSAPPMKIHRADAQSITVFTTRGDNVFFNVSGVTLFPVLVFNSVAYVYTDLGDRLKFYGAGSAFLGGQVTNSGAGALEQEETFARLLLGTKGQVDGPNIPSAKLHSLNPQTLVAQQLVDLQNRFAPLFAFGFGPGSIGALLNLDNEETDVFAFDLINVRYRLLTDGTDTSEFPTF